MTKKYKNIVIYVIGIKFLIALVACFGYFSHPHITRQIDTMSVALNYWLRRSSGSTELWFLPGSLGGGETMGIVPMEFPILNMFLAPFFSFGHRVGFNASFVAMIMLNFGLGYFHFKEWKKVNPRYGTTALLMFIFGLSGTYIYRVMPDFLSMTFVSLACARSYQKPRPLGSFCLLALGLLMKPTSAIALAILLMRPLKNLKHDLAWIMGGVFVAALYYTVGVEKISELSQMSNYFKVTPLAPTQGINEVITNIGLVPSLLFKDLFIPGSIFIFILVGVITKFQHFPVKIVGLIVLQLLTIFSIDGAHSFEHPYYFIGTSFLCCLLLLEIVEKSPRVLAWALMITIVIYNGEWGFYRLKPIWKNSYRSQADSLIKSIPELKTSRSIRTKYDTPPE